MTARILNRGRYPLGAGEGWTRASAVAVGTGPVTWLGWWDTGGCAPHDDPRAALALGATAVEVAPVLSVRLTASTAGGTVSGPLPGQALLLWVASADTLDLDLAGPLPLYGPGDYDEVLDGGGFGRGILRVSATKVDDEADALRKTARTCLARQMRLALDLLPYLGGPAGATIDLAALAGGGRYVTAALQAVEVVDGSDASLSVPWTVADRRGPDRAVYADRWHGWAPIDTSGDPDMVDPGQWGYSAAAQAWLYPTCSGRLSATAASPGEWGAWVEVAEHHGVGVQRATLHLEAAPVLHGNTVTLDHVSGAPLRVTARHAEEAAIGGLWVSVSR